MDIRTGFMTVFVVSGSVVILAHQIHKRLLSDFMKKIEFELGPCKSQTKKKVRFLDEEVLAKKVDSVKLTPKVAVSAIELGGGNKKCRKTMPLNWQVMYKGIINYRNSIYIQ
ncbi:hypothetical protein HanXRQr2_Chr07g0304181 [Helianthus annuus]|uniref:Transmembrane protein n=1 Tax=Helianthus annuus TaxID=4232 RepID=A0A251UBM5_HELAN|nr:hypothetical protein HanXRQr2_Chr07g0304181 [Helianthus annuus]